MSSSPGLSLTPGCVYLESRYMAASRHSETLRNTIRTAEQDINSEFRAREEHLSNAKDLSAAEVVRLKQELNRVSASCTAKSRELERLKQLFDRQPDVYGEDQSVLVESPADLQERLAAASERIVREEQTTEVLKQMLEKVTQAEMIMKQRTREVMGVYERVEQQLRDVRRMQHIAENYLTLANNEKVRLKTEMDLARDNFRLHFKLRSRRRDSMTQSSKRLIERIGLQLFTHTEVTRQRRTLVEGLDSEFSRFREERGVLRKAEEDLLTFRRAFAVVERVMRAAGCDVHCSNGVSPAVASAIVTQFNTMLVFEGSLASRYNELTWDYTAKEAELVALRQEYEGLLQPQAHARDAEVVSLFERTGSAESLERTTLALYTGLLELLNLLQTVHARVCEQLPAASPALGTWNALKSLTKGFRLKKKDAGLVPAASYDAGQQMKHRHMTSLPVRAKSERSEDLETIAREVNFRETAQYQPLTQEEVSKFLSDSRVSLPPQESLGVVTAFSQLSIVKYFADLSMLREVLHTAKTSGSALSVLIEKAHTAMRAGFRSLTSYAKEALSSFLKEEREGKEIVTGYNRRRSLAARTAGDDVEGELKEVEQAEKELVRVRLAALCPQPSDTSADSDTHAPTTKRTSLPESRAASPASTTDPETQHILATRQQLKTHSLPQVTTLPQLKNASASAGRLRRFVHDNPTTERAKSLLRDYLTTERKIMTVRCAERTTLKTQSARNTPTVRRYHRFQVSPRKAKPQRSEVRRRLIRSQTTLSFGRFNAFAR